MTSQSSKILAISAIAIAMMGIRTRPIVALAHESVTSVLDGRVGNTYTQSLQQSGGVAPYKWSLARGSRLPRGLTLDEMTGVISGKPAFAGTTEFAFHVSDSSQPSLSATEAYTMKVAPEPFSFENVMLKGGYAGQPSVQQLIAHGGLPPYTWSVASGSLPDGMKLDATTGRISGTPVAAKTTAFTIEVRDSAAQSQVGWQRSHDWVQRMLAPRELPAED